LKNCDVWAEKHLTKRYLYRRWDSNPHALASTGF
jgi:hypothetical protein